MKGYLAGSLFNKAEVNERLREGKLLKENFKDEVWYNPIEAPINDKSKLPTANDIFLGDYNEVLASDVIIADLTNNDPGVAMELGIAVGLNDAYKIIKKALEDTSLNKEEIDKVLSKIESSGVKNREVFAHNSDIRVNTSGEYEKNYVPYGQNQFVVGAVEYLGNKIYSSIEDIIEERNKDK